LPVRRLKPIPFAAGIAVAGLLLLGGTPLSDFGAHGSRPAVAAALTALMAIWWIGEALPILWTACVPLVVLPLSKVHGDGVAANFAGALWPYFEPYVFLFLGGMGIAAAMQQWNLHRRIALRIMALVGTEPRRLLLGMLCATAFVSLWISNSATAAMMFPIGMALIAEFEHETGRRLGHYGAALMLAIAYAANLGGVGTKVGTVPSAQLSGFLAQRGVEVPFLSFMALGIPFASMFLLVVWWKLWRLGREDAPAEAVGHRALASQGGQLGPMQRAEWIVLGVFLAAGALWIASVPLTGAARSGLGWEWLRAAHVEAAIALAASGVLMAWRSGGRAVLEPRSLRFANLTTLLIIGGGFSMAAAIEASGLSEWIGTQLAVLRDLPGAAQIALASLAAIGLSAVASNAATVAVLLPILGSSASPEQLHSVLFAATFAASCDFALPAGTPPNAIVFGSGYVTIPLMARIGVQLDLAAALWAALWCALMTPVIFP
jgi:sodium-dependent dicarboxylate transporter 2/3/5